MSNAKRNAEIIRLLAAGGTFGSVARALGISRNTVAGVSNRVKHPYVQTGPAPPFRNEEKVRAAVRRVTEVGLMQAASEANVHYTQVYRWWKRLEAIDGVKYKSPSAGGRHDSKLNRVLGEIVARRRSGDTLSAIARSYSVSKPAIHFALRRAAGIGRGTAA